MLGEREVLADGLDVDAAMGHGDRFQPPGGGLPGPGHGDHDCSLRFQAPMSSGHPIGQSAKRAASRSIVASSSVALADVMMPYASATGSTLRKVRSRNARPLPNGSMRPATSVPSGCPMPACAN